MGRKLGGCAPFGGELGPHLTQCRLGQGLPPYQVGSWSIQPFGDIRHVPKIGGVCHPFLGDEYRRKGRCSVCMDSSLNWNLCKNIMEYSDFNNCEKIVPILYLMLQVWLSSWIKSQIKHSVTHVICCFIESVAVNASAIVMLLIEDKNSWRHHAKEWLPAVINA